VIHLYAFALEPTRLPDISGIAGSELRLCRFGTVAAVTSMISGPADPSRDALQHGFVVEALLDCADGVLPVRFGEEFADEEALARAVEPKAPALERRLRHVAGFVEVGVQVREPERAAAATGAVDGLSYMQAKLAARREHDSAIDDLRQELSGRARDVVVSDHAGLELRHEAGYLVSRTAVAEFAAGVARYIERHPELAVVCTGPWAPYSFTEVG
jgi:hypothetical protein